MDYYKYWLLKEFDLIMDVKNYIKQYTLMRLIKPLLWGGIRFINYCYIKDDIVYRAQSLSNWHPIYHLSKTHIHMLNNNINKIEYIYNNHLEYLIGHMVIEIDFALSHINSNYITTYTKHDLPSTGIYTTGEILFLYNPV